MSTIRGSRRYDRAGNVPMSAIQKPNRTSLSVNSCVFANKSVGLCVRVGNRAPRTGPTFQALSYSLLKTRNLYDND